MKIVGRVQWAAEYNIVSAAATKLKINQQWWCDEKYANGPLSFFISLLQGFINRHTHTEAVQMWSEYRERLKELFWMTAFKAPTRNYQLQLFVSFNWNKTPNFFLPYTPNRWIECCCFIAETREREKKAVKYRTQNYRGVRIYGFSSFPLLRLKSPVKIRFTVTFLSPRWRWLGTKK